MMPHPAVTSSVWKRGREGGKERDKGERGEKKLIFSKMNAAKSKCSLNAVAPLLAGPLHSLHDV